MLRPIFIHGLDQTHLKTGSGHSRILDLNYVIRNAKQIKLFWWDCLRNDKYRRPVLLLIPSALLISNKNCFWRPLVVRNDDRDQSWFRCQLCFFPLPPFLNITSSCVLLFTPLNKLLIEQHKTWWLLQRHLAATHLQNRNCPTYTPIMISRSFSIIQSLNWFCVSGVFEHYDQVVCYGLCLSTTTKLIDGSFSSG